MLSTMTLAPESTPLWKTSCTISRRGLGAATLCGTARALRRYFAAAPESSSIPVNKPVRPAFRDQVSLLFPCSATFSVLLLVFQWRCQSVILRLCNPPVPPYPVMSMRFLRTFNFHTHFNGMLAWNRRWEVHKRSHFRTRAPTELATAGAGSSQRLYARFYLLNPNFGEVLFEKNGLTSDYDALQVQFQRKLSRGLQGLASYTWSMRLITVHTIMHCRTCGETPTSTLDTAFREPLPMTCQIAEWKTRLRERCSTTGAWIPGSARAQPFPVTL